MSLTETDSAKPHSRKSLDCFVHQEAPSRMSTYRWGNRGTEQFRDPPTSFPAPGSWTAGPQGGPGMAAVVGRPLVLPDVMAGLSFLGNPYEQTQNSLNCVRGAVIHISSANLPFYKHALGCISALVLQKSVVGRVF